MPTRFTPEQLAASASAGEPRVEDSFSGDRDAWHAYQAEWFTTFTNGEVLPPVGDGNRAKRWKAARRQHGKIEAQREKAETADVAAAIKRFKVPDQWVAAHVPALRELNVPSPVVTPNGRHAKRQLSALMMAADGSEREYTEEVCYTLPPRDGELQWRVDQRDDAYARNMLDLDEHAARDEASGWLLLGNERRMRRTDLEEPVDRTFLGGLRRTSPADLAADEAWRFAPVGVLSHVERDTINHAQLERFARAFGLPLVKMARAVLKRVIGFINLAAKAVPWGNRERAAET